MGKASPSRVQHLRLPIEGMDCSDCVIVIEHSVGRLDGVLAVSVNYASEQMRVDFDGQRVNRTAIERRVRSLGYTIPATALQRKWVENRALVFSLLAGLLFAVGWVGERFFGVPGVISLGCYVAAYVLGGWNVARHAFHSLRERQFNTDLLMVVAALGAAALGEFAEGALLLFLFSLGHALEDRALDRSRNAIRALANLAPKTALARRNGQQVEVAVERLQIGDLVIVKPGARLPVDGTVEAGQSAVNQAPVTGESVPVEAAPGRMVFAGSVNGEGVLEVRVTRLAKDSTLARVAAMVEEAQAQKSPTQQSTERFTRVFVPAVLIGAFLLIMVPPLFGVPFRTSFLRAMTLLVAASPCALALGAPAAVLAGVAQAARNGVLVKGGIHLENLGRLRAIAFDKTGTVTYGRPELTDIAGEDVGTGRRGEGEPHPRVFASPGPPVAARDGRLEVLRLVAALESQSAHPLSQAIVAAARAQGLALPEIADVEAITGRGLRGMLDGQLLLIGSVALIEEAGVTVSPEAAAQVAAWQADGKTVMLVALGDCLAGMLAVADTVRPGVREVMAGLRAAGIAHTIMLTGDNTRAAAAIAQQAGIDDYRADLMPEDKVAAMRQLVSQYGKVGMVGDGVNDAPALASALVGIAMGGAGTDVALETADVALMADDLSRLPFAIGLARATRSIMLQNLVIALGVIGVLTLTSLFGLVGIGIAILFHEGSTIVVALNALRLLGYRTAPSPNP